MRNLVMAVLAATIINLIGISAVTLAYGSVGGRPANPDPKNPRSNTIFIYELDRGRSVKDQVLVTNTTDSEQAVKIYSVDGIVTNTGAYTCEQESESRDSIGQWLEISSGSVILGPGEKQKVDFTLDMPEYADVGEHNGCIVFQTNDKDEDIVGNVRIRTRQAVRVVATVPGDLKRDIAIKDFNITSASGGKQFELKLLNTGNVSADVDAYVYLDNLWGKTIYKNGGGYPILANNKLDLTFNLDNKPMLGGWYKARAGISYDKRAGEFGVEDQAQLIHKNSDSQMVFLMPTAKGILILAGVIVALIGLIIWLLRSRYQALAVRREWVDRKLQPSDTINSIADLYGISWRKLARVNRLSAPYNLDNRDTLRVPLNTVDNSLKPIEKD